MPDPYQVFHGNPSKQKTLAAIWPELHDALAGISADGAQEREKVIPCCVGECAGRQPPSRAVGRPTRWGHAMCAMHLGRHADRPGGWPLDTKAEKK